MDQKDGQRKESREKARGQMSEACRNHPLQETPWGAKLVHFLPPPPIGVLPGGSSHCHLHRRLASEKQGILGKN